MMQLSYKRVVIAVAYCDIVLCTINLFIGIFYNFLILLVLFHAEAREYLLGQLDNDDYSYSYPASSWVYWSAREISRGSTLMMGLIWGCTLLSIVELLAALQLRRISDNVKALKEVVKVAKWWMAANGVTLLVNTFYYLITGFTVHPIYWLYFVIELIFRGGFDKIVRRFINEVEYHLLMITPAPAIPVRVVMQ